MTGVSRGRLLLAQCEVRGKEALEAGSGVSPGPAAAAHGSRGCQSPGDPKSLGDVACGGRRGTGVLPGGRVPFCFLPGLSGQVLIQRVARVAEM